MSFRNIKCVVPRETSTCELVQLVDTDFKHEPLDCNLPASTDYSLKDLLAAGVKVAPVDPTVVHDSASASSVADAFVQSQELNDDNNNTDNN